MGKQISSELECIESRSKYYYMWLDFKNRLYYLFHKKQESNLLKHTIRELKYAGYDVDSKDKNDPNKWMIDNIVELMKTFIKQGHSGFSASYCITAFEKLARFEPLTPLKGTDDEWVEVTNDLFQNKRDGRVFKPKDGKPYFIEGKVFIEENGSAFTSKESKVEIEFPYMPKTEYIYVKPQ